jgi:LDH2 family malate/lactate/ureidoglycolate dehydrogenase
LFAKASRDGVHFHGLKRFPPFVRMVKSGIITLNVQLQLVAACG